MDKRGYKYLEHMSDAYVEAYGETLEEAFEEAAEAMFNIVSSIDRVRPSKTLKVVVDGMDLQSLLYNWLEKLVQIFELEELLLSSFQVTEIRETESGFKLQAVVKGERFDPSIHPTGTAVKSSTYHLMEIERLNGKVMLRYLLDI